MSEGLEDIDQKTSSSNVMFLGNTIVLEEYIMIPEDIEDSDVVFTDEKAPNSVSNAAEGHEHQKEANRKADEQENKADKGAGDTLKDLNR